MSRRPAVSHGLILALAVTIGSLGSSFQVAASSPSADWHSHAFYTDTPLVRSYTSWNIYTPMYQWGYNTIVDPSVTSGSAPVNLINYYGQDVYYYAWVHLGRGGGIVCGGLFSGDTGNCNHTTLPATWGTIHANSWSGSSFGSLSSSARTWTLAHEFGHIMGLAHHNLPGLMYGSGYSYDWPHVNAHLDVWYD